MRSTVPALMALAAATPVVASVIDQHNEGPLSGGTSIGVITTAINQSAAQTFTPGLSGRLDAVEVYIYAGGTLTAPLILEIRPVSGGIPDTSAVLASQSLTPAPSGLQWVSFDLSGANLSISEGQSLAIVLRSAQNLVVGEYDAEGSHDVYAAGASFVRAFDGPWQPISDYDLMFRTYVTPSGVPCYANCDRSTTPPILNVNDFICFLDEFAAGSSEANCDGSTTPPILNVNDFVCFQTRFAAGCP